MKHPWISGFLLWFLAVGASAGGEVSLAVQTVDGNQLVGTSELGGLSLETSLGKVDVLFLSMTSVTFRGQDAQVQARDGSMLSGKVSLKSLKIRTQLGDFEVPLEKIRTIRVMAPPAPPVPAPPALPVSAPPIPKPGQVAAPSTISIQPVKELPFNVVVGGLALSADGSVLYVLNVTDSKLLAVDCAEFKVRAEVPLEGGGRLMSVSPDGAILVTAEKGTLNIVDLALMKQVATCQVEAKLVALHVLSRESALAVTEDSRVVLISLSKRAIIQSRHYANRFLCGLPDHQTFYCAGSRVRVTLSRKGDKEEVILDVARYGSETASVDSPLAISSDGCYGAMPTGKVLRLGRSHLAEAVDFKDIPRHTLGLFLVSRLLLFEKDGKVTSLSVPAFDVLSTDTCGLGITAAVSDERQGVLYAVGHPAQKDGYALPDPCSVNLYEFKIPAAR